MTFGSQRPFGASGCTPALTLICLSTQIGSEGNPTRTAYESAVTGPVRRALVGVGGPRKLRSCDRGGSTQSQPAHRLPWLGSASFLRPRRWANRATVIQRPLSYRNYSTSMNDFQEASDAALVLAVARWHEGALAEAYRRHAGAVYALASRVIGRSGAAEEVVQEVFLRLWNEPEKFDPGRGSLRSFLLAQSHSKAVDAVRSEAARRGREEREARLAATASYDVDHEVWDLSVAENVKQAIRDLPVEEREAIELAYFGGHTYREVATILDQPEGTIKSRIRAGLNRARVSLVKSGVVEQ